MDYPPQRDHPSAPRTRHHPRSSLSSESYPTPPGIGVSPAPTMAQRNGFTPSISRSPPISAATAPSNKNTRHVPCKFFRQGACTAGDACPYSHADTPLEPCKFFLNGNCKYGQRCALPHILHGRILNPQCLNPGAHTGRAGRHSHPPHALSGGAPSAYHFGPGPDGSMPIPKTPSLSRDLGSPSGSTLGSPALETRLALSPQIKGFSALDAPLPASYNSQEIPNIAKFGPNASSVPAKSGWNPLTSSSPTTSMSTSTTAFPGINTLALVDSRDPGTSPPAHTYIEPHRILLSDRRSQLAAAVSASLPAQAHEIDPFGGYRSGQSLLPQGENDDDTKGEEFIPSSLSELLTDQEKFRRFSRSEEDRPAGARTSMSSFGSPGSPSHASPSRFGAFFANQAAKKDKVESSTHPGSSPFGHVGSPLRSAATVAQTKPRDFSGSPSFGPISPPRSTDRSQFVSSLSEQLKEMGVGSAPRSDGTEPHQAPHAAGKAPSTGTPTAHVVTAAPRREPRGAAAGQLGRDKIDEEPWLFSIEDIKDDVARQGAEEVVSERRFADVAAMTPPAKANGA